MPRRIIRIHDSLAVHCGFVGVFVPVAGFPVVFDEGVVFEVGGLGGCECGVGGFLCGGEGGVNGGVGGYVWCSVVFECFSDGKCGGG